MIIKINYNKSTKQIVVSNDNKQILLSVTDSTIVDTDDELSFEIAGDLSLFQDMLTPNPMDEIE
jgi:outer membrane lipoprotein-sorting protein